MRPAHHVSLKDMYTADESEFIVAMDRFKREQHVAFPTWSQVLSVVKSLGYAKPAVVAPIAPPVKPKRKGKY